MRWIEDDGSVFEYSYRKVKKRKKKRKSRKSAADEVDGLAKVVRNVSFLTLTRPLRRKLRISADSSLIWLKIGTFFYIK